VIRELRGEKIDIVQYDDDPSQYVRNALNPAAINRVAVREYETRDMEVIVSEDQLSLAIGRKGQNVRLASKLVGWNLDIKSEMEKKAEVEAEMERMAVASRELSMLQGVDSSIGVRLLDAGFRALEEVSQASMEDLTGIDGVDEELAIRIHDAAEEALAVLLKEREEEAARAAAEAARLEAEQAAAEATADEPQDEFVEQAPGEARAVHAVADLDDPTPNADAQRETEERPGEASK
jgi:N utilization substance protein A